MVDGDDSLQRAVAAAFERLAHEGYGALSPAQRVLVCVWGTCGEIDNGGFDQFFFNTSGDWAGDAEAAFRTIGAHELAAIVRSAIEIFPDGGPSPDHVVRHLQLDGLSPEAQARLSELDRRFDSRNVDRLLAAFVEQNLDEILRDSDA
jgi:hypothetical protein